MNGIAEERTPLGGSWSRGGSICPSIFHSFSFPFHSRLSHLLQVARQEAAPAELGQHGPAHGSGFRSSPLRCLANSRFLETDGMGNFEALQRTDWTVFISSPRHMMDTAYKAREAL